MLWAILATFLLGILPLRLTLTIRHLQTTQIDLAAQLGMLRHVFRLRRAQTPSGPRWQLLPRRPGAPPRPPAPEQARRWTTLASAVLRADHARRFLWRHIHWEDAAVRIRLGLSDAARTAQLTGLLQCLTAALPPAFREKVRCRVWPDFLSGRTAAHLVCIVSLRLGTLFITGLMAAVAYAMACRARPPVSKEA